MVLATPGDLGDPHGVEPGVAVGVGGLLVERGWGLPRE